MFPFHDHSETEPPDLFAPHRLLQHLLHFVTGECQIDGLVAIYVAGSGVGARAEQELNLPLTAASSRRV